LKIIFGWIGTPFISGIISFSVLKIMEVFIWNYFLVKKKTISLLCSENI
jgi:phosphate/sulfate permease